MVVVGVDNVGTRIMLYWYMIKHVPSSLLYHNQLQTNQEQQDQPQTINLFHPNLRK